MADAERLRVGLIMGSDSDWSTVEQAGFALQAGGLEERLDYETRVISAHRTTEHMMNYAATADERGLKVIIPFAGGSAHLQGMVSSETALPVLGVAVTSKPEIMNRALGSLIGMPEGKPLITFQSVFGARAAGKLALKIIIRAEAGAKRVAIIGASGEDMGTMQHATRALTTLGLKEGLDYTEGVLSGDKVDAFSEYHAQSTNLAAIIVGSRGNSQLARKLAERTSVPVLGVALTDNADTMTESLRTLVYPNEGMPIAAFQANAGAFNAGLMAARIVGLSSPGVKESIHDYNKKLKATNLAKDSLMQRMGATAYMALDGITRKALIDAEMVAMAHGQ